MNTAITKAHQRIIRERKAAENGNNGLFGVWWRDIDTDIKKAEVRSVSYQTAKAIILDYEWLGTMAATSEHYGIYWQGNCGGVVCFGQCDGWTHRTVLKYGVSLEKTWVLSRGACVHWAHPHSASKIIASALKLHRQKTGAEIVIAYSDPEAGEIGTVYQATNWIYLGVCKRNADGFQTPNGERLHRNVVYDMRRKQRSRNTKSWSDMKAELLQNGWSTYKISDKGRYVFAFDKRLRTQIQKDSEPYPKRNIVYDGQVQLSSPD